MRTEREIFEDLAALCTSTGYAHAIAFFCYRDNVVGYGDELKGEDFAKLFSMDRLIGTEISTLIGLMTRAPVDYTLAKPEHLQVLIGRTEALLQELHKAMMEPMDIAMKAAIADGVTNPFSTAEAMREPIFYAAESAYSFQYRDLAPRKYARDEDWLRQNKGFSIDDARRVIVAITSFLNGKLLAVLHGLKDLRQIVDGLRRFPVPSL